MSCFDGCFGFAEKKAHTVLDDVPILKSVGDEPSHRVTYMFSKSKPDKREKKAATANGRSSFFENMLGHPGEDDELTKGELETLPVFKPWDQLPDLQRINLNVAALSAAKETDLDWENQDAHVATAVVDKNGHATYVLGVFDGHGLWGRTISQLAASRVPGHMQKQLRLSGNPKVALEATFEAADRDIFNKCETDLSGSTGVVAVVDHDVRTVHIANVGDSRIILGRCKSDEKPARFEAVQLTTDHKPDLPEEQMRIEMKGGKVAQAIVDDEPTGPMRVWDHLLEAPGLAMSRSLGDGCGREVGVISTPEVTRLELTPQDHFLIIASDGLFDLLTNEEAVAIGAKFLHCPNITPKALIETARRRGNGKLLDDTTVVFVGFKHANTGGA
eukprot:gnl/TRDRNA2_/TRDRNA2_59987_c0_seq1.p1 gnl/TRDRNA2_/TRDRNA2_59987_c0~~gnl/TRDRNA2_/TRDRNA2_59987_c0_seq1.p1  ORF type:complete len:397 (+),score=82.54 gnl/TRDRNA2_/TRDRNA2_59987_c0_seq1:28-1191(+)